MKKSLLNKIIGLFVLAKLIIHAATNSTYGLHRDEYLYIDQATDLQWGYFEIPPMTPLIGKISLLLGGSDFAIRMMPAIAGAIIIALAIKTVDKLGGNIQAAIITGCSLLLSTSLLGSNNYFQPVSFNQMMWMLLAYQTIKIIQQPIKTNYLILGTIIGLGMLTKYSISFYIIGLLAGILITPERKLIAHKWILAGAGLAMIIFLPNLYWQVDNGWPFFTHMEELRSTQLSNIALGDYFKSLFFEHKGFSIIWITGLLYFLQSDTYKVYRYLVFSSIITIILIGILNGKPYYAHGAFLMLFPLGGIAISQLIQKKYQQYILITLMTIITLPFYPLSLPIYKISKLKKYCKTLSEDYGINYMLRWEDGSYHELPQDISDTFGWKELVHNVNEFYSSLPDSTKLNCSIIIGPYGQMGAYNRYRKNYNLPEAYSFGGSYVSRLKKDITYDNQIMLDDRKQSESSWFETIELVDSTEDKYARDPGYIYYRTHPKIDLTKSWNELVDDVRE